jgi:hypothetical protein
MLGRIAFFSVIIAVPAMAAAAQDDPSRGRVDAVLRCIDVPTVGERLQCYDRSAAALRESLRTGQLAVIGATEQRERSPTPSRIDAAVTAASAIGNGGWRLELDNGQIWQTYERQRREPPPPGTRVRIRRNLIGSMFLTITGYSEARVTRVQ